MYGVTTTPVQVSGLTNVAIITAGMKHSIALKADGTVWAWGRNYSGQLGDGTNASSAVPVQVSGLTDVTAITAGGDDLSWWGKSSHTIALKSDGTVWAWGSNEHGQLGVTTTEICEIGVSFGEHGGYTYPTFCSTIPVQVSELTDITAIAAGGLHTIALKSDSTVWAWGDNEYEQLGATTTETCGYENNFDCSPTPVPVKSKATGAFSVGGTISGLTGTLVLQNNGGDDLTIAENGSFTFATELEDLAIYDITVFTQPLDQTCSVSSGRINAADVIDIEIKCFTFVAIAAGGYHTLALETDGTVWAWGSGSRGQLGDGTMIYSTTTPIQVSGLTDVAAISAGSTHTIALKNDGTVWAWGDNTLGQLGVITTESCGYSDNNYLACSTTPVQVSGLTDVAAISAGSAHTIALKNDGTVWAWGRNDFGQLGVETIETCGYVVSYACSTTPVEVSGLTDVTAIVAGGAHTITLRNDGTVWAWGDNNAGQLGDGTTYASTTPVQVSDLTDVVTIAAGSGHTLAIKTDGTAWAWGWNRFGQLGDGTTIDSSAPIQVSGLTDVATVATGNVHTIALKNDSTIWAWGSNSSGELGAVTMDSSTPVQVLITP